jgi:hypothetical protein
MFAAIQKCPSGRFGASVTACRPAAIPRSRNPRRSWSGVCRPSQYDARDSFHAASKFRGSVVSISAQMSAARRALTRSVRFAYSASGAGDGAERITAEI